MVFDGRQLSQELSARYFVEVFCSSPMVTYFSKEIKSSLVYSSDKDLILFNQQDAGTKHTN